MHKLVMMSVRDAKLNAWAPPMCGPSEGVIIRSFMDEVRRAESPMHAHPEDYELWRVGTFDEDSATLSPLTPECVLRADAVG